MYCASVPLGQLSGTMNRGVRKWQVYLIEILVLLNVPHVLATVTSVAGMCSAILIKHVLA